jgi:bifunctional non-homologous end joining protein LigD
VRQISLYYKDGSSNKEYHVQVKEKGGGYVVDFQYGRVGSSLASGSKTTQPVDEVEANHIFDKLVKEKKAKGYTEGEAGTPYAGTSKEDRVTGLVPQLPNPIEESEVEKYLKDPAWGMQEKKDGKHIMLSATPGKVVASNRKGLSVAIPEPVVSAALGLGAVTLDGEAIGNVYWAFDCLSGNGLNIEHRGYRVRYDTLVKVLKDHDGCIKLVPLVVNEAHKRELYNIT